jgi:4-hydroxy-tetrahydrodipicolinate reductase
MIKVAISGICGRMGQRIMNLAKNYRDFEVIAGFESKEHPQIDGDIGGVKVSSDPELVKACDCLIDFSLAGVILDYLPSLIEHKKPVVIGTTGFSDEDLAKIKKAAEDIPILLAPNMSIGVNVLFRLIKEAANMLKTYNVFVEEAHHIHKKDSPSGTAKKIVSLLNQAGFSISNDKVEAIREGEIIGDHSVVFRSDVDEIEVSHSAKTRDIFAQGALFAAKKMVSKKPGFYSMEDLLFNNS